ncbi:MAG: undecaprenyl-phosphate glucose phosphotransferase [Bacteroidaceae bacterium]
MKQRTRYSKYLSPLMVVGDFLVLNLTSIIVFVLFRSNLDSKVIQDCYFLLLLLNLSFIPARLLLNVTVHQNILFADEIIRRTFYLVLLHMVLFFATLSMFQVEDLSRLFVLLLFGALSVTLSAWRLAYRFALRRYRRKGFNYKNVVILGMGRSAEALYREMVGDTGYGYRVLGFFSDHPLPPGTKDKGFHYLGKMSDALDYLAVSQVDEVYCAYSDMKKQKIRAIITYCEKNCIRFFMVPLMRDIVPKQYELSTLGKVPVLSLHNEPLQLLHNRIIKRTFDIVFSSLVLIFVFPIFFVIVAPLIKLSSRGPIFFGQRRNGEMGRVFTCYKFRSMVMNPDSDKKQTVRNDPRKTWIGNIIRKTSIDELPQFYNVLRGDMSVVGPRPHMLEHTRIYSELVDKYMLRHLVKPGITGWAQIHGLRGEIRDVDFMRRRVEADVWYIEHWSFFLDLKIIYKTFVGAVFGDKNAI